MSDDGTDRIAPAPGSATETAALKMVIDDAVRQAAEIAWLISDEELLDAL